MSGVLCRQAVNFSYKIDCKDQEQLFESFMDTIHHIEWMFTESELHEMRITVDIQFNGKQKFNRLPKYNWDKGEEGFKSYLEEVKTYLFGLMAVGKVQECEIGLLVYDVPMLVCFEKIQEIEQLISDNKCAHAGAHAINEMLKKQCGDYQKIIEEGNKLLSEHMKNE